VLSLRGTKSNRDAIGSRVEVDGQVKWVTAGQAYLSQHTKRLHFGLDERGRAEKFRIHWPSGLVQDLPSLEAGFRYEVTEGADDVRPHPLRPHTELPDDRPMPIDNRARLQTTWLREPVPLPEKRRGPAIFVLHAGESLPELPVQFDSLDLRKAPPDLVAAYSIIRRYLFDYRADLETPFWMLLDSAGQMRKVYGEAPDAETATDDLRTADGPAPDPRGLPFNGYFAVQPRRDYYKFGGALLQSGYGERALPYFEEELNRNPNNAIAHASVGRIHLRGNRLPQARQALLRATSLNPSLPEVWNELGGVEAAAGNNSAALGYYEKALELGPNLSYALVNTALTHNELGNVADAERLYRRALEVDPQDGEVANSLGILLAKQGRTDEARKLFESALSIRPDDASAINNLGILFLTIGQTNDAIAAFQHGIKVAPDDEKMYLNLAGIWVRMGDREKARELMLTLQERNPNSALARKALEQLAGQ
jgi:Flp pilus assembly protein TadD